VVLRREGWGPSVKILDFAPHSRDTLTRGCLILNFGLLEIGRDCDENEAICVNR